MFGSPFFHTPNVEKCSPFLVPHISKERFRAICERYHCKAALYCHLSMVCTYIFKETPIFVATGKILKYVHADMSLRVPVLSFSILKFNFKCLVLLSLSKSFPLLVSHSPNFFFKSLPFLKSSKFGFY